MRKHLVRHRELNLTDIQAKAISSSLKPDREINERDSLEDSRSNLTTISNKRTVKQVIRCLECNDEVKSIRKLIDHLSEVHYQRELTALERKEIRLRHGVQKLHHCQFCSLYFIDYRLLRSHVLAEHVEHAEDLGFAIKSGRRGSNATHKCPNCSMLFHLRAALDEHIVLEHLTTIVETNRTEPLLQFRCWYCSLHFQTPEEVVTHMTEQHETLDMLSKRVEMTDDDNNVSSTGLWACPHCPENLKTEGEYRTHLTLHVPIVTSNNIEESSTVVKPPDSHTDETSSYLNPIHTNESVDCVVKKYLKTESKPENATSESVSCSSEDAVVRDDDIVVMPPQEPSETNTVAVCMTTSSDVSATSSNNTIATESIDFDRNIISVVPSKGLTEEKCKEDENFTLTEPPKFVSEATQSEPINVTDTIDINTKSKKTKKKKKLKNKDKKKHKLRKSVGFSSSNIMESCRFCSDVFNDKVEMNNHIKVAHSNEDGSSVPFRCWFCTVSFSCPEDVVSHMTNEHDNLDNLSRRIEMTELTNQLATEMNNRKLILLKRSADASLSPVNSLRCPECPKKLGSKEAYELHMMVHEASHNTDLLKTGSELLNRSRSIDRSTVPSNNMDDVSLAGNMFLYLVKP